MPEEDPRSDPAGEAPDATDGTPVPPDEAGATGRRARLLRVAKIGLLVCGTALLVLSVPVARELARWPSVTRLRTENPATTAFIERWRKERRELGRSDEPQWRPVPLERISPWLRKAVIVSEDIEFLDHDGFSRSEARAALEQAVERRRLPRGASTLTQQLAKNLWLSPARSPARKLREGVLTVELERALPKTRILELYLNVAEFGPGVYGAEAAAWRWFGVPASDLGPRQAAMLAASLPRPRSWNPESGSAAYRARVERVLDLLGRASFLDRRLGLEPGAEPRAGQPVVAPPETTDSAGPADTVAEPVTPVSDTVGPASPAPPPG
jgi:monofunctional glycosyltransferase